jgi:hypothetical protein
MGVNARRSWATVWVRPSYPIFRRELAHWDQHLGGRWRLEEIFALFTLVNLCLLPAALLIFPWLLLVYALFDEALGLFIILPAALLVVRERERGTWSVLRTTPAEHAEVVTGKLGGLLYLVWEGATYLVRARVFGTLLALPLFALMLTLENPFPLAAGFPAWLGLGILVLSYGSFLYRPLINLLCGGALGMAASTMARSSTGALTLAVLFTAATLTLTAALVLISVPLHGSAALFSESVLAFRLEQVFMWLLPLALVSGLRLLLIPISLAVTVWRMRQLSG